MRKLLTFLIALASIAFGVCSPASAQMAAWQPMALQPAPSGGGPLYLHEHLLHVAKPQRSGGPLVLRT
jgi:hypothetical protein